MARHEASDWSKSVEDAAANLNISRRDVLDLVHDWALVAGDRDRPFITGQAVALIREDAVNAMRAGHDHPLLRKQREAKARRQRQ